MPYPDTNQKLQVKLFYRGGFFGGDEEGYTGPYTK